MGTPPTRPSARRSPAARAPPRSRLSAAETPDRLQLALRGSGQSLYVGLAEDAFVVASEPYGVVAGDRALPADGGRGLRGRQLRSGARAAARWRRYARRDRARRLRPCAEAARRERGAASPRSPPRDIDRTGFPHFLLKEISEAPQSFMKTLRGKIVERADGRLGVKLGSEMLPPTVIERLQQRADRAHPRDRPGHRRGRRPECRRLDRRRARLAAGSRRRRPRDRALGLRARRRHERHARDRRQPVGHHHRHQPHRRPGAQSRRPRARDRQPARAAISWTRPTACSTPPTGATSR